MIKKHILIAFIWFIVPTISFPQNDSTKTKIIKSYFIEHDCFGLMNSAINLTKPKGDRYEIETYLTGCVGIDLTKRKKIFSNSFCFSYYHYNKKWYSSNTVPLGIYNNLLYVNKHNLSVNNFTLEHRLFVNKKTASHKGFYINNGLGI